MKIEIEQDWYDTPEDFKTPLNADGTSYSVTPPVLKFSGDLLTIGKYTIRIRDGRELKRALEALYP